MNVPSNKEEVKPTRKGFWAQMYKYLSEWWWWWGGSTLIYFLFYKHTDIHLRCFYGSRTHENISQPKIWYNSHNGYLIGCQILWFLLFQFGAPVWFAEKSATNSISWNSIILMWKGDLQKRLSLAQVDLRLICSCMKYKHSNKLKLKFLEGTKV